MTLKIDQLTLLEQGSDPAAPASGKWHIYFKSNGLFIEDDAGNVTGPFTISSNVSLFLENTASDISGYKTLQTTVPSGGEVNDSVSVTGADTVLNEYAAVATTISFIPAQVATAHLHLAKTAGTQNVTAYVKLFHRTSGGTETLLGTSNVTANLAGSSTEYEFSIPVSDTIFSATDRFVLKIYVSPNGGGTTPTANVYFQGTTSSRVGLLGTSGAGSSAPFDDGTAIIKGSADPTKLLRLEVDGFTTGTTRVVTPQDANGTMAYTSDLKGRVEFMNASVPTTLAATQNALVGASSPAEQYLYWDFVNGSVTYVEFLCRLIVDRGGGLTLYAFVLRTSAAAAENYVFEAAIRRIQSGIEEIGASHTYDYNAVTVTVPAGPPAATIPMTAGITFTDGADMDSLSNGEFFYLRFRRNGGTATDTARVLAGISMAET
jgi:hypothetical protein